MNWTGGRRAGASKTTNGPAHRQKQYFARVRAAKETEAYSAASEASSPNYHEEHDAADMSPPRKRHKPMPEFDILRDRPSKSRALEPADIFDFDDVEPKRTLSLKVTQARKKRLLEQGNWVGVGEAQEINERDKERADKDRAFMEKKVPATRSPSKAPSQAPSRALSQTPSRLSSRQLAQKAHPQLRPTQRESQPTAPTIVTAASRDYGPIQQWQPLSQGGYIRIGRTTLPPPPKVVIYSDHSESATRSKNPEGTSQDSMLLDYEEMRSKVPEPEIATVRHRYENDDLDFNTDGEFDPWDWREGEGKMPAPLKARFDRINRERALLNSPAPGSLVSTSPAATKGGSDIFAFDRNPSSPPSASNLLIRGNMALGRLGTPIGHEFTPSSPTRINLRMVRRNESPTLVSPRHDTDITLDNNANPLEDQWRDFLDVGDDTETILLSITEREREDCVASASDIDHSGSESELPPRARNTDFRRSNRPPTPRHTLNSGKTSPVISSPPIQNYLPSRSPSEERSDNDAWLSFTAAVRSSPHLPSRSPTPPSPKLPELPFTASQDRAWRGFVRASEVPSDEELEKVIAEESGHKPKEQNKISSSEVSMAVSGRAEAGSSTAFTTEEETHHSSKHKDGRLNWMYNHDRSEASEVVGSVVAVAGTEVGGGGGGRNDVSTVTGTVGGEVNENMGGIKLWKPPKRFEGDRRRKLVEEEEDIEDW